MVDLASLEGSYRRFRLRLAALAVLGLAASAAVLTTGQGAGLVVLLLVVLVGRAVHAEGRRRRWLSKGPVLCIRTTGLDVVAPGSRTRLDWDGIAAIERARWRRLDIVRIRLHADLDPSDPRITTDLAGWRWWRARRHGIRLAADALAIAPGDLADAVARLSGGRRRVR